MPSFFEKFFRRETPPSSGSAPSEAPHLDHSHMTNNEKQGTTPRIETTPDMQKNDAEGFEQLRFCDVKYVIRKEPKKTRGDDALLIHGDTGFMGIADGVSGSRTFGEHAAADASVQSLSMLADHYEQIRKQMVNISYETQHELLLAEQRIIQEKYGLGANGTFEEQLNILKTHVGDRTIKETLASLFALTRSIDTVDKNIQSKGQTTLSIGKTIPLADGRHVAIYALVGDSYILIEDEHGNMTNMIPPQTWAHYLEQHPEQGPQEKLMRKRQATTLGNSIGMPRSLVRAGRSSLARMGMDVSVGITILEPGESIIFASDGIDTIANSKATGIANALNGNFEKQADDISVVRCTPQSTEALQQAA